MEKYVKKTTKERFSPLLYSSIFAAGGVMGSTALLKAATKQREKGNDLTADLLSFGSTVCGIIGGISCLTIPGSIGKALDSKKLSPEYQRRYLEIVNDAQMKHDEICYDTANRLNALEYSE